MEEKAGFSVERLRWELNPRWRICNPHGTNENTGNEDTPQQIQQQLESTDPQNTAIIDEKTTCLTAAIDSVRNSRLAVEKLLDSIPLDDHYSISILGPILTGLRDAEREIGGI